MSVVTNAEARFNDSLRPRKPEGSLGRTAQDGHLDSHKAPELWKCQSLSISAWSRFHRTVRTPFTPSERPFLTGRMFVRPNLLRTLRRTTIRFLIELLVRRIWFGQSKLYFILKWLVMRCKLRPGLAADAQQTAWWKM